MADGTIYIDTALDSSSVEREIKETEKEIKKAEAELDKLIEKQIRYMEIGGKTDSKAFAGMEYDIGRAGEKVDALKTKLSDLQFVQAESQKTTARLKQHMNALKNSFHSIGPSIKSTVKNLPQMASNTLISGIKKFGVSVKGLAKRILGIDKNAKQSQFTLKRMIATSLLLSVAFRIFTAIMNGIKVGFNNLSQYSSQTNKELSALKSSLTQLKNSFATAFAPLLSVVTPILTGFINMLSKAISYIGMFISALTGKNTFIKAVAVQEDYAAGLRDTAGAAKDAEKAQSSYLSGLDEINRFETKDASTSGGSGGGKIDPSEMFEEVEIPDTFKILSEKIKENFSPIIKEFKDFGIEISTATNEWFADLDWQPLLDSCDELMGSMNPLVALLLNGLAWAYTEVLLPFGKWTIEKGLPLLIEDLGKAFEFVIAVVEFLIPIMEFLWKNILEPFGVAVGEVIENVLIIFGGLLDFLTGIFTGDWNKTFSGLETMLFGFYGIVESIFNFIKNQILVPFDNFLMNIFTKDWTNAFGVVGDVLNGFFAGVRGIYAGVKQILGGIIEFVAGVFTGDWRRAWNGVREIFRGVFNTLVAIAKSPINIIIGLLNGLISGVVKGINDVIGGINKIKFTVPSWVPVFGGKSVGFNLSKMSATKIPYLATGAVIPPNAPFMAVLGDQKRGTNIEAPLETIKQAVAEVLGNRQSNGGTYTFVGQINRRTLFEETIEEAKVVQMTTGKNPFELA